MTILWEEPVPCSGDVLLQVENVNTEIAENLVGLNALEQEYIDAVLTDLDGTRELTRIGRSAILAASMACGRAAAASSGLSLYNYIGGINARQLPIPVREGKIPQAADRFVDAVFMPVGCGMDEPDAAEINFCEYGTLSEIMDAAHFACKEGQSIAVVCPESFTGDSTSADISVALNADYIMLNRADISVINRLIRIEEELSDIAEYAGI